ADKGDLPVGGSGHGRIAAARPSDLRTRVRGRARPGRGGAAPADPPGRHRAAAPASDRVRLPLGGHDPRRLLHSSGPRRRRRPRGPAPDRRGTGHRAPRPCRARRPRRCAAERCRDDRADGGGTEHVGLRLVRSGPGRLLGRRAAHLHTAERCDRRAIMTSPTVLETFLWVIIPYMALAVFVLGHIWRFRRDRFGWTSRSSQIYESKLLRIGSPLFHYGIIFVFLGHVIGLGIPKSWTSAVGITDHMYHF